MRITSPNTGRLAAAFSIGAPGGAALVILSWWLLTGTADLATQEGDYRFLVAVHILVTSVLGPFLIGIAAMRLFTRLGWEQV